MIYHQGDSLYFAEFYFAEFYFAESSSSCTGIASSL